MKIIGFGIIAGIIMLVISLAMGPVLNAVFPGVQIEYENTDIFRPWSDPLMSVMFVQPFLLGVILAWIWSKTKNIIKGATTVKKGIIFGFAYWVITIPGMVISYSTFQISLAMVFSWSLSIFIQALAAGAFFARTIK